MLQFKEAKNEVLKEINNQNNDDILTIIDDKIKDRGFDINVKDVDTGIQILTAFLYADDYISGKNLPSNVKLKFQDEFRDNSYGLYMMLLKLKKEKKININIYEFIYNSVCFMYDTLEEIYKENGIEGITKYISILNQYKENFKTPLVSVYINDNFKKYMIYLTSSNYYLSRLNTTELYTVTKHFSNDKFLSKLVDTSGEILFDIARVINRMKMENGSLSDIEKRLDILSKNVNYVPHSEEKTINL